MTSATTRRNILVAAWAIVEIVGSLLLVQGLAFRFLTRIPVPVMQWSVLHFTAGVAWPFAAVAIASQVAFDWLYPIAFRMIGTPAATNSYQWIFLALNTLLAIPVAGVLAYYTRRGWLWIATPAIGFFVSSGLQLFLPTPDFTAGANPTALAIRLVIGILEGVLLAYILSERIAAKAAGKATAAASTEPTVRPGFPIGAALAMAVSLIGFGVLSFGQYPDRERGVAAFSAALAISYLAGVILLAVPRARAIGAGLGFGSALIAVVPTVYFVGFITLLGGLSAVLLSLAASQIATVVLAFLAVRREGSQRGLAWMVGIIVPIALLSVSTSASSWARERASRAQTQIYREYDNLQKSVQAAASCLSSAVADGQSYPRTLDELAGQCAAARTLPADTWYLPAHPTATGVIAAFSLCSAMPADSGGFVRAVGADSRGVWTNYMTKTAPQACAVTWSDQPGALLFCLFEYETKNPAKGLPASIKEIGPEGTNCLAYEGGWSKHSVESREHRLTYIADAPEPGGRITKFQIIGHPRQSRIPAIFTDETGVWRHTLEDRMARADDPVWPVTDVTGDPIRSNESRAATAPRPPRR